MNTRVILIAWAAAACLSSSPAAQPSGDAAKARGGAVVSMRGCVSGSLLKSVQADPAAGGAASMSDRYRMIGSKTVRGEIKKANKKYVALTGRVQPGPQATTKGTTVGGTAIGIGVTQGTTSGATMPYTPTVEVDSIDVLAETCGS